MMLSHSSVANVNNIYMYYNFFLYKKVECTNIRQIFHISKLSKGLFRLSQPFLVMWV